MNGSGSFICPILVGRDDLLALADRRLEAGRSGDGHLLFLAGEAGIGKTRVRGSIERRAASLGYRVVRLCLRAGRVRGGRALAARRDRPRRAGGALE